MALNFPDNPSLNDTYVDSTSGFTYTWNGTVWLSVVDRKIGNIKQIDDISSQFNGTQTVFTILSNGQVIAPLETNKTIISVGGVLQNPGDDYSVFGTQITFSTPPTNGLTFFGQVLQTDQSKSTLPDRSVDPSGLTTGGFSWNSSGDFIVSGILTSGTSSITIDGSANQINVGTAVTINTSGITAGIITATLYGDGSNLEGVGGGVGPTDSVNTTGIITASSFTGDGRNLTDVGGYLAGLIYSPGIGQTDVSTSAGIAITFTKGITKNTGIINLRENAIDGTIAESFDIATVGSSSTIAIAGAKLSITPDTTLGAGTTYFVEVPANVVRDNYDTGGNLGITSFTFVTAAAGVGQTGLLFSTGNSNYTAQNDAVQRSSPTQIPGTQWNKITGDQVNATAYKSDGTLWVWGAGSYGALGQNDEVQRSSPIQIPGTQWTTNFDAGFYGSSAIKTDGTLWTWGVNDQGQLGINLSNPQHRSSPVQVPGTQWNFVTHRYSVHAKKTDGTLWAWGYNAYGQLGINDALNHSSPYQIPGTQWNNIDCQGSNPVATKTDGTLWVWGYNNNGQLGQNDKVSRSSPIQVPGTQWNFVSTTYYSINATKTDGTLWSWGWGQNGKLGQNDEVDRSSPTQIPGTQWSSLVSSQNHTFAKKTDGTLWAWALNGSGSFGINDTLSRSSPTQIPGTQWTSRNIGLMNSNSFFIT